MYLKITNLHHPPQHRSHASFGRGHVSLAWRGTPAADDPDLPACRLRGHIVLEQARGGCSRRAPARSRAFAKERGRARSRGKTAGKPTRRGDAASREPARGGVPCRWLDAAAARFAVRVRETDEHWQPCSLRNNFPVLCSDRLRCIVRQKDRHLGHCRVMELLNQPESELRSLCVFFFKVEYGPCCIDAPTFCLRGYARASYYL